jgi:hypothetical protein
VPVVESRRIVPVEPAVAFAISQTQGEIRKRWDPFIAHQHLMGGATEPAEGVRTSTVSRLALSMVSEGVSRQPPTDVGMRMTQGSWSFARMGGGWRFASVEGEPGRALATWRYDFACRPAWLAPVAERIGAWILQRDMDRRIDGFARGCADPVVLAHVGAGAVGAVASEAS